MIHQKTNNIIFAILLLLVANFGLTQDFEQLTKDIQISFPETKGIIKYRPSSGIPFPEPKHMKMGIGGITLAENGKISCSIILQPNASITEKSAARELSDQIAFMAKTEKGPETVKTTDKISTPSVCILGTDPELFKSTKLTVPKQPEGFAIRTGKWHGMDAVFIAGKDRFGVYWGVQTLKQMLLTKEKGLVITPNGSIADWPDAQYRHAICIQYMLGNGAKTLAYLVRNGRTNATTFQLMSPSKIFNPQEIKNMTGSLHKRGIICIAFIYWTGINRYFKNTRKEEVCPLSDMKFLESLVRTAFESGADGISINFDDLSPAEIMHYAKCPRCTKKFKNAVEQQVYVMRSLYSFAKENGWGNKLFLACPTLYAHSKEPSAVHKRLGLTNKNYYPEFCGFPESSNFRFFHCDSSQEDLKRIKDAGLKNYAWWNNGPWSGAHNEVWRYDVAMARMGYSWGMYDRNLLKKGNETFYPENLAELRSLKGETDFVFNGTNALLGQAIGCIFGWDMENYMSREPEFQEWFMSNYSGKNVFGDMRIWEWTMKPLMAKFLSGQPFDKDDGKLLEIARLICDRKGNKAKKKVLKSLQQYNDFYSKVKETGKQENRISFTRKKGCLLSITPHTFIDSSEKSQESLIIENWNTNKGLKLTGCSFIPAEGNNPAKLSSKKPEGGLLSKNIDVNISGFKFLTIPCNLSRDTALVIKAVIDGIEHVGTPTMGHAREWQELILPISGKKLNSISLHLSNSASSVNSKSSKKMMSLTTGVILSEVYSEVLLRPMQIVSCPETIDTLMISDEPIKIASYDDKKGGFLLTKNKLSEADDRFTLSQRPFSIETKLIVTEPKWGKIIGTRASFTSLYKGIPGWGLGLSQGGFAFTLEDKDKLVSTVSGGGWIKRYTPYHVIAVRDFPKRKLRLYVNGQKVSETDEKGSGIFGDEQRTLGLSFDAWTGGYIKGLLKSVKIYDRALSDKEVQECFSN